MTVIATSVPNVAVGWALVGLGGVAVVLALVAAGIEAFRKALASVQVQSAAGPEATVVKAEWPWDKVIDAIKAILLELLKTSAGPIFFMGLVLIAGGVLFLHYEPL